MKRLYFNELKGVLTDECTFGVRAMVGSLNCQECKHCLAMDTKQNWVKCELNEPKKEDNEKN